MNPPDLAFMVRIPSTNPLVSKPRATFEGLQDAQAYAAAQSRATLPTTRAAGFGCAVVVRTDKPAAILDVYKNGHKVDADTVCGPEATMLARTDAEQAGYSVVPALGYTGRWYYSTPDGSLAEGNYGPFRSEEQAWRAAARAHGLSYKKVSVP
jgi:hypothetical protein